MRNATITLPRSILLTEAHINGIGNCSCVCHFCDECDLSVPKRQEGLKRDLRVETRLLENTIGINHDSLTIEFIMYFVLPVPTNTSHRERAIGNF